MIGAKQRWKDLPDRAGSALLASLLAAALTVILSGAVGMEVSVPLIFLLPLGITVLCAAVCTVPLLTVGVFAAAGVWMVLAWRSGNAPWNVIANIVDELDSGAIDLASHAAPVVYLLTVVISLLCYAFARMQGGIYPAAVLFIAVSLSAWYAKGDIPKWTFFLTLPSLAAMLARSGSFQIRWKKIVPFALIASLIGIALMPAPGTVWQPMADAAEAVRDIISDYFRFTSARTSYSVSLDGYQPMGERLGGPANPSDEIVMSVETDTALLLRGSVRDTYTGHSWVSGSAQSRYLYIDPMRKSLSERLFGRNNGAEPFTDAKAAVTFLSSGTSTLFMPEMVYDIKAPLAMAIYYNDSGEIFLTRDVEAGDAYTVTGAQSVHGRELAQYVAKASGDYDAFYEEIRQHYTQLPQGIDEKVYTLATQVAIKGETDYEKVYLLCEYLKSGTYAYKLDVGYPPGDDDFVSYFLLDSKEGYCTYFAASLAVMARTLGIPARYIEGYSVPAGADGTTIVTGENAHAWVEVYFRNVGWIAFDPTPGQIADGDGHTGDNPGQDDMQEPESTPEPDIPDDEEQPEPTSEPDEPQEPEETEEPPLPDETETPLSENSEQGEKNDHNALWVILAVLLVLLAAAYACRKRERASRPESIARKQAQKEDKLMVWYAAMLSALSVINEEPLSDESPVRFAHRIMPESDFEEFASVVSACRYAKAQPNDMAFTLAQQAYESILARMSRREKLVWTMRRMRRGTGNWRKIPQ